MPLEVLTLMADEREAQGALLIFQRNWIGPDCSLPLCTPFHWPATMVSFRTRSAMRTAMALRCDTSPARLAIFKPSTITGTTAAIRASATSISTSVNAAWRKLPAGGGAVFVLVLNFIVQLVGGGHDPDRRIDVILDGDAGDAQGIVDRAVRRKINRQCVF